MWPFSELSEPNVDAEAVTTITHFKVDRLAATEIQYREAEQKFQEAGLRLVRYRNDHRENQAFALAGHIFLPVNPLRDVELSRLEHDRWRAEFARNELLNERAELRKSLGLTR
jgi:hypothetical protein